MNTPMHGNQRIYLGTCKYAIYPSIESLIQLTETLARSVSLTPLRYYYKKFDNGGVTFTRFLAESHITLDVYVETNIIELMIVSCKHFDTNNINKVIRKSFQLLGNEILVKNKTGAWYSHKQKCIDKNNKRLAELRGMGICIRCRKNPTVIGKLNCGDCIRITNQRSAQRNKVLRERILDHYGAFCNCCGESNILFLNIDHVENDGYAERKIFKGALPFYNKIIREGYPESYQILCSNCNDGKRRNGGICPHKGVKQCQPS